jgi:hypothetical protein
VAGIDFWSDGQTAEIVGQNQSRNERKSAVRNGDHGHQLQRSKSEEKETE